MEKRSRVRFPARSVSDESKNFDDRSFSKSLLSTKERRVEEKPTTRVLTKWKPVPGRRECNSVFRFA